MSAQPTLQLVNGTGPSISDVRGDQPPGLEQESGTATDGARAGGEAGNGEAGLTREDPALATRQSREVTDTSPGDLPRASGRERTMQEAFLGTRDSDPAQASGIVRGSGNVQPSSQMGFLTPRSTLSAPPGPTWLTQVEMPRWMTRLGSYLNLGMQGDPLMPSPLAGTASRYSSPPGGESFVLRSPPRRERPPPPPGSSSSSIPAEAIQLEVQRQLGGMLNRLQIAEMENERLRSELEHARRAESSNAANLPALQAPQPPPPQEPPLAPVDPDRVAARETMNALRGASGSTNLRVEPAEMFAGRAPIFGGPGVREEARGLLGDLLTAPSGPGILPGDPMATSMATTTGPPAASPVPEPPLTGDGFLRGWLGSRGRSNSPHQPQPSQHQPGSPVIDALTKSIQQLQELQAQAMTKGAATQAAEQIKPGTLSLAPLPDPKGGCDAALQFQDWLEVAGSVFADVSELSGQWWKDVVTKVESTYSKWLAATPLERLSIVPVGSDDLVGGRWTRLNARVSSMLLTAMGEGLRSDMVAQRLTQDAVRMVFRLHTTFQPGGSAERQDVLRRLQAPQEYVSTESLEDALKSVRAWPRWLARCKAVNMNPPDASVLARGLMAMTSKHINASPDAAFRTSMLRTSLRLDAQPSLEQVAAYQRHLQAELETLVSAAAALTPSQPGLRAIERATSSPKGSKEKGGPAVDACRYFLKPSGCKRGARCTFSHSMASLDKETRNRKCLQCGSEAHRQRECPVTKGGSKGASSASSPLAKGQRQVEPQALTVSTMTPCTTPAGTVMSTSSTVPGTPWTLETLMQAAQQVVRSQGSEGREDSSPEKVKPEVRTLKVKDIKISSLTTSSSALLDSGATHSLRNAYSTSEWDEAEDVVVELAGKNKLTMKLSTCGTLLMPPRLSQRASTSEGAQGNTIVSMGELVRTLGYTLEWGRTRCLLRTGEGEEIALATHGGCPYLCEAEALSLISRLEDRKRERLENETATTLDRIELAALRMDRHWMDNLCDFAGSGSMDAGVRSLRDADFLRHLPAECLDGLLPGGLKDEGWGIMRKVDFLTRAQRRYLWGAKKWMVHLYAGGEGHHQFFQLDCGDTAVIELDIQRCKGHDVMSAPVWRMLMWGAVNGKIDGVIGGPPGRGGVDSFVDSEDKRGLKPMKLIARMMWLYATATAARQSAGAGGNKGRPVAFMLEHPAKEMCKGTSLWELPMWTEFQNDMDMNQVTFDQGSMGGEAIRTTLGTNVYYLMGLDQVGVEGDVKDDYLAGSSGVWSSGFVSALVLAMKFWDRTPRPLVANGSGLVKAAIQDVVLYLQARGLPVYRLHSDKGEVYCHSIRSWLRDQGIRATFSEPGIPQGNGAAETTVRWLKDRARTMLIGARLPTRLWPTAVEAAAAQQRSKVLGGRCKLLVPYGAPVYLKQKAFDSSGPRRRERAFETRWIKGRYVGLSNLLDNGHVVFVPGGDGQREKFLHTFHVRTGLVDPGDPVGEELHDEPPKPRRRLPEKTSPEKIDFKLLSLSMDDQVQYIRDRSRVLLNEWDQEGAISFVSELADHGFFDDLKFGVFRHGGSVGWLKNFKEYPELTRVLSGIIHHDHPEATFTAIMVTKGNEKGMHKDFNNDEDAVNYVMPISIPRRGGELWVELGQGDKVSGSIVERRDDQDRPHYGQLYPLLPGKCNVFSPRRLHEVLPWDGKRTVLIGYTPQGLGKITSEMVRELEEFGFTPPLTQYPEYFLLNHEDSKTEVNAKKLDAPCQEEFDFVADFQAVDSDIEEWEMYLDTEQGAIKVGDARNFEDSQDFVSVKKVDVTYTKGVEDIIANLKGPLEVTYTVDPREVYEHLEGWAPAIKKEVEGEMLLYLIVRIRGTNAKLA
eukprot:s3672_g2.t1